VKLRLPAARGPLSNFVIEHLRRPPHKLPGLLAPADDPLRGDDFHLALYCCYRLHGPSFDDVDEAWEWNPTLIDFREGLERQFRSALTIGGEDAMILDASTIVGRTEDYSHPTVDLSRAGSYDQFRRLLAHRALMAEAQAVVSGWMLHRLPADPERLLEFSTAAMETVADFGEAGIEPDLELVSGAAIAAANLLFLLALGREQASVRGALAVAIAIDRRSDSALAHEAKSAGYAAHASALERASARAAAVAAGTDLLRGASGGSRGPARAGIGAQWMLAASVRATDSLLAVRSPRDAAGIKRMPFSSPA
jgi:hypothetical protein